MATALCQYTSGHLDLNSDSYLNVYEGTQETRMFALNDPWEMSPPCGSLFPPIFSFFQRNSQRKVSEVDQRIQMCLLLLELLMPEITNPNLKELIFFKFFLNVSNIIMSYIS